MMKQFAILFSLLLALSMLLFGCGKTGDDPAAQQDPQTSGATSHGSASAEAAAGTRIAAPDFTVYDAGGNPVHLSDFLGKPVVLNFWASWCGPCKAEMPDFQQTYEAMGEQVQFMIVNLTDGQQETVETASGYIAGQGYSFPVFYDTASEAAYLYGIRSIPTTFFIDAEGYAVTACTGAMSADILQQGIDLILPAE